MKEWRLSRENYLKFNYFLFYRYNKGIKGIREFPFDNLFYLWLHDIFTVSILFFGGELIHIYLDYPTSNLQALQPFSIISSGCGRMVVWESQCLRWVMMMFWVGWGGLTGCLEADSPVYRWSSHLLSVGRMRLRQTEQYNHQIVLIIYHTSLGNHEMKQGKSDRVILLFSV